MSVSIKAPDENPSNVESILSDTIGLPGYTINSPGSRIEELLIELNELIKSGGGSDAYAADLSLTIDSSTYVITAVLKNKDGESIGTPQTIDLPMESVVVSGTYNSQTKKVVLTLQNDSTIEFSVADLISGLQEEITSSNKLDADLVDDANATNKFATAAQLSQIETNKNNISNIQASLNSTSSDAGKVLTADGEGGYDWQPASGGAKKYLYQINVVASLETVSTPANQYRLRLNLSLISDDPDLLVSQTNGTTFEQKYLIFSRTSGTSYAQVCNISNITISEEPLNNPFELVSYVRKNLATNRYYLQTSNTEYELKLVTDSPIYLRGAKTEI